MATSVPTSPPATPPELALRVFDLRRARTRTGISLAVGFVTYAAVGLIIQDTGWALRVVAGWNAAAVTLLGLAWSIIWQCDVEQTRCRAAREDPGRNTVSALVLAASTFSLFSATYVLRRAKTLAPNQEAELIVLCLAAVVSAWCLTHTAYTLRYAHLYYRDDDSDGGRCGGLGFPGDEAPNYFDFAYFSFTVGMCFQVSDVTVISKSIRRAVLMHSVLSFAYNTAILALAMNLVAGLLG